MLLKISIVVAMCSGIHFGEVQKKMAEVQAANPGATVSVRVDKRAVCSGGLVLSGKDARLMEALNGAK